MTLRLYSVNFRAFTTARGGLMLEVLVNGNPRYTLGPFDNKQQRLVLAENLRRAGQRLVNECLEKRRESSHAPEHREQWL